MTDFHAIYTARREAREWLKVGRFDLAEVALRDAQRLMPMERVLSFKLQCPTLITPVPIPESRTPIFADH